MSDRVVLVNNGYIVAEGNIHGVRDEVTEHPMQILIRCDQPAKLAAQVFAEDSVVEARLHNDRGGLFVRTRDADKFYLLLNRAVADEGINVESVARSMTICCDLHPLLSVLDIQRPRRSHADRAWLRKSALF